MRRFISRGTGKEISIRATSPINGMRPNTGIRANPEHPGENLGFLALTSAPSARRRIPTGNARGPFDSPTLRLLRTAISLFDDLEHVAVAAGFALEDRLGNLGDRLITLAFGEIELGMGELILEFGRNELQHLPARQRDTGLLNQLTIVLHQRGGTLPHEVQPFFAFAGSPPAFRAADKVIDDIDTLDLSTHGTEFDVEMVKLTGIASDIFRRKP